MMKMNWLRHPFTGCLGKTLGFFFGILVCGVPGKMVAQERISIEQCQQWAMENYPGNPTAWIAGQGTGIHVVEYFEGVYAGV